MRMRISIRLRILQIMRIDPGAFSNLTRLTDVSLTFNNLTTISAGTFRQLPSLYRLDLGNNNIGAVEDDFDGVADGVQLLMHNNKITQVDHGPYFS